MGNVRIRAPRRALALIAVFFLFGHLFSQNKRVFADDKTIQISSARLRLKDDFVSTNLDAVKLKRDSIKTKMEDAVHLAFFPGEYWLLCVWTRDFNNILTDKYLTDISSYDAQGVEMPVLDDLGETLRSISQKNATKLRENIEKSSLSASEKELLDIVLLFSIRGKVEGKDTIQSQLNELARKYVSGNSTSVAVPFISTYVIQDYVGTGRAHEVSLGGGVMLPNGGLADYFGSGFNIGIDIKEYFNWVIVGLTANISNGRMSDSLDYDGRVLQKDSVYTSYYVGLDLGARLFENRMTCVNVIGGVALSDISVSHEELNSAGSQELTYVRMGNNVSVHFGGTLDLKFLKMGKQAQFKKYSDYNHSNFFRLKYLYQMPFYKSLDDRLGGGFHSISLQIGFNTKNIKRQ